MEVTLPACFTAACRGHSQCSSSSSQSPEQEGNSLCKMEWVPGGVLGDGPHNRDPRLCQKYRDVQSPGFLVQLSRRSASLRAVQLGPTEEPIDAASQNLSVTRS